MAPLSVQPSRPGEGCGPAAMSNLGFIGSAFVPLGPRPIARMMRMLIRDRSDALSQEQARRGFQLINCLHGIHDLDGRHTHVAGWFQVYA
jgi:hypothetical protein